MYQINTFNLHNVVVFESICLVHFQQNRREAKRGGLISPLRRINSGDRLPCCLQRPAISYTHYVFDCSVPLPTLFLPHGMPFLLVFLVLVPVPGPELLVALPTCSSEIFSSRKHSWPGDSQTTFPGNATAPWTLKALQHIRAVWSAHVITFLPGYRGHVLLLIILSSHRHTVVTR